MPLTVNFDIILSGNDVMINVVIRRKDNDMEAIDKNSPLPLYFQVKEDIEKKIKEEVYIEGEALPSEIALIDQYNVSRTTIRQAVEQLVNDGLLERRRGKGTFVKKERYFLGMFQNYVASMMSLKRNNFLQVRRYYRLKS
ncbi:GntR family transcriptional regulator [Enterococcus avium]|uniref:GntR family transcriptional regulator n=1 Tax=Enterococcus avium TaxID=33945 RepID=UPI001D0EB07E|nr:GntR family transcriptional regulator [Enterococcus avium]